MTALAHEFDLSQATMLPPAATGSRPILEVAALAEQWLAVHEAAAAVAVLAQLGSEATNEEPAPLPLQVLEQDTWHYAVIARGIDDLAAIMKPGLRALLALTTRGQDATAAAIALWSEFHFARAAILDVAARK